MIKKIILTIGLLFSMIMPSVLAADAVEGNGVGSSSWQWIAMIGALVIIIALVAYITIKNNTKND